MERFATWYQKVSTDVTTRAQHIKLLICDIDGVFSDGSVYMANNGEELKAFNTKDGFGLKSLMNIGCEVAVITGRSSKIVEDRMTSLGVKYIYQGMETKLIGYEKLCKELSVTPSQVAFIGDDFPDVPVMKKVGLAVSVADGHPYVKEIAHYCTVTHGGKGAVRELTDLLTMAQKGETFITSHFEGSST
ncbi:3-deoxy-manno-octulosonate-8-phosphatase KdsC [Psychrosphaera aestuarii]|uniref:3-deoxy-manno-octulosonate-8-phosphatase KdsC n=1 Tax=Psychrosphaera aestuarii TaxID=1266052 RepID=UPI001B31CEA8|nr:3-deoxy-manno-octulosonate-8-phosphatase KdsC [Psychrosphaera aestuarii]